MEELLPHRSAARVATPLAHRYLIQLCKHFQHRLAVSLGEAAGRIAFPDGLCLLSAEPDWLELRVAAPDAAKARQLQDVIARHLMRFAFRDPPEIVWRDTNAMALSPPA